MEVKYLFTVREMDARCVVAKHLHERIEGGHRALLGGSLNAHDDGLSLGAARSAVAARGLAVDHRRPDGLFCAIVRRIDVGPIAKEKLAITIPVQMDCEANAEGASFSDEEMQAMLALAKSGIAQLVLKQREVLSSVLARVDWRGSG